jgi:SAM-dependent methyltransferase
MSAPLVFDRALLRTRRRRAVAGGAEMFLLERAADEMAERLAVVLRHFDLAVDLGTPGDALARSLAGSPKIGTLIAAEPDPHLRLVHPGLAVAVDAEASPFAPGSLDLVVSALSLQAVNDLPGTLVQVCRALKPDGLFLAALLGGATLTELRQSFAEAETERDGGISPRVAPFADVRDMGSLLQRAGFALPVTDIDRFTVRYASPFALMVDLRRMGATNPLVAGGRGAAGGGDTRAGRGRPGPAGPRDPDAHGGHLRGTLLRSRRPRARHLRIRVAVRLGAPRKPAAAAQARLRQDTSGRCAGDGGSEAAGRGEVIPAVVMYDSC